MPDTSLRLALLGAALFTAACSVPPLTVLPPGLRSPFTGYSSPLYRNDRMWLCRPDLPADRCRAAWTAAEIHPNGRRTVAREVPAAHPGLDCFYVYPSVDLGLLPGNDTDFDDLDPIAQKTVSQAVLFGETCAVYVPLYRQITIGTYVASAEERERRLAVAFSDVQDAFVHYMGQYNHGRKVVLLGHSQGADMIVRLLQHLFDHDPVMRERLLVAMPIGIQVEVPKGRTSGGTFATVPICTRPDELGCVVAYRSFRAGAKVSVGSGWVAPKPGNETVCVNPAAVGGRGAHRFSRSYFATKGHFGAELEGVEGTTAPFVMLRDFYSGACMDGPGGVRYLAVAAAPVQGDRRVSPIDLGASGLNTDFGLHVLDFQFPLGDLIDLAARKAKSVP